MEAKERAFDFMAERMRLEIPFFQRRYVWNEDNWEELIENLKDDKQSHFLGSIILKKQYTASSDVERCSVIDGQQRLTTLSILVRACYDSLPLSNFSPSIQSQVETQLTSILFYKERMLSDEKEVKIMHSMLDSPDYKRVINGELKDKLDEIILESESKGKKSASSNIVQCYKYFMNSLTNDENSCRKIWEILTGPNDKIIVKIDLSADENEQAIFDTINSAGVRLTCFDTIKNAIFQKAIENARTEQEKSEVIENYKKYWQNSFTDSTDTQNFWSEERNLGRIIRNNQEILLHCIALIKGFFDPDANKISDLSQVYKEYIKNFNNQQILEFIQEIAEYALIYRNNFVTFEKSTYFSFDDSVQRLFHVLNVCEISTFHPYILKLFKDYNISDLSMCTSEFLEKIRAIEKYVIRHIVCRATTKNFNKECAMLINGKVTIEKLFDDKKDDLSDASVKSHLMSMPKNKIATLLLFWIELKRRSIDSHYDTKELKYAFSLEHVMPQKWQANWGIDDVNVIDVDTNQIITDQDIATDIRNLAVYEIGNMTLLNSKLNSSISNYEFKRKIKGEGRKKGIEQYASLSIAQEIVDKYNEDATWNEKTVRDRTERITTEFLTIW